MTANATQLQPKNGIAIQSYARLAGLLGLVSLVAGAFGEGYVPGVMIVSGDAAATAHNIIAHESLFRWGFAAYTVEALCDLTLTMLFWVLFRPAHPNLAFLMVLARMVSTIGFATAQVQYFGALQVLDSAEQFAAFPPAQLEAVAYTLIRVGGFGGGLFSGFYGVASIMLGYLILRSRLVPPFLGVIVTLMGIAFVTHLILLILAPAYASFLFMVTSVVAFLLLSLWLLIKGVDVARWRAMAAA